MGRSCVRWLNYNDRCCCCWSVLGCPFKKGFSDQSFWKGRWWKLVVRSVTLWNSDFFLAFGSICAKLTNCADRAFFSLGHKFFFSSLSLFLYLWTGIRRSWRSAMMMIKHGGGCDGDSSYYITLRPSPQPQQQQQCSVFISPSWLSTNRMADEGSIILITAALRSWQLNENCSR